MLEFLVCLLIDVKDITVSDGDTVKCKDPSGKAYTVRLIGLDSPEKKQVYGLDSKAELTFLTSQRKIVLQTFGKDKYGRTLGVLHGVITPTFYEDYNAMMVRRGAAWNYGSKRYIYQEWLARRDRIGLWKDINPLPPWDFRKQAKKNVPK